MSLDLTSPQIIAAEFNDRLSDQLLLQPDPQYIFAKMLYAALVADALAEMDPTAFELAKLQAAEGRLVKGAGDAANLVEAMAGGMGGPLNLNDGLSFPEMAKMVREAHMPGEVIKINRPAYINGDTTPSKRAASPTTKLFGTNSQPITMQQVAMTILENLGPADASGNLSPISLPRFTAHRSAHDLLVDVGMQLRRDRYRFLDDKFQNDIINAATNGTNGVTRPVGVSGNSSYTAQDNEPMSFDLLVKAGQALKERFIPGIGGGPKYLAVLSTNQTAQLKLDPQFQRLATFYSEYNPLFPGAFGEVDTMVLMESTRLPTLASQGVGSNVTLYQGVVLAPGAYGWGCAQDAIALRNRNDDGGRNNEFGWSAYEALQVLDERFFQVMITD